MACNKARILKEVQQCKNKFCKEIVIQPCIDDDLFVWKAFLRPSKGSLYYGMKLELDIKFPQDYPYSPPSIRFVTPTFHPNINANGTICISTLAKDWSPALTLEKTLLSILSLLDEPNPLDPLRPDAAELYLSDIKLYKSKALEIYNDSLKKIETPE